MPSLLEAIGASGSGKSSGWRDISKNTKSAVRPTHFQMRSEAHDTYILLAVVFFLSIFILMSQKRLFKIFSFFSFFLFIITFAGWGAGSHGHMFANRSEAMEIGSLLIMLSAIPFIRYFQMKSKSPNLLFSILTFVLLAIELVVVCYFMFEFRSDINPLTFFMAGMIISVITQMSPIYKQIRS